MNTGVSAMYGESGGQPLGVRELLGRIRDERWMIYSEGPGHLGAQKMRMPPPPVNEGIARHRELFQALLKSDDELTGEDKQRILDADPRMGFTPPDDWRGAAAALRELGDISNL